MRLLQRSSRPRILLNFGDTKPLWLGLLGIRPGQVPSHPAAFFFPPALVLVKKTSPAPGAADGRTAHQKSASYDPQSGGCNCSKLRANEAQLIVAVRAFLGFGCRPAARHQIPAPRATQSARPPLMCNFFCLPLKRKRLAVASCCPAPRQRAWHPSITTGGLSHALQPTRAPAPSQRSA